jgi:hypothetical protein
LHHDEKPEGEDEHGLLYFLESERVSAPGELHPVVKRADSAACDDRSDEDDACATRCLSEDEESYPVAKRRCSGDGEPTHRGCAGLGGVLRDRVVDGLSDAMTAEPPDQEARAKESDAQRDRCGRQYGRHSGLQLIATNTASQEPDANPVREASDRRRRR